MKRKRRLIKANQGLLLPLSAEFVAALHLTEGAIVEIDEERLAQAIKELSQEDILQEVLNRALASSEQEAPRNENSSGNHSRLSSHS